MAAQGLSKAQIEAALGVEIEKEIKGITYSLVGAVQGGDIGAGTLIFNGITDHTDFADDDKSIHRKDNAECCNRRREVGG